MMKPGSWKKKLGLVFLSGCIGFNLSFILQPAPAAQAINLGGIIGTAIQGMAAYKQVDSTIKRYNETEEGRTELFNKFQKEYGVSDNTYREQQLDVMMTRLEKGIAASDPTVYKPPYMYFINKQQTFNAFCSLGHVMSVNEGIYTMTDNQDEIAVILAHEMAHGQKNHVASSIRKKLNAAVAAGMLGAAAGGGLAEGLLNIAVNQVSAVSITKKDEWAADDLAFQYIIDSGYNPGATAALWQRVEEKYGKSKKNFAGEIFSPSDHPSHKERRENYVKKLYEYSNKHATAEKGAVKVNGKVLVKPAAAEDMSGAERSYMILGNLAAAYHNGHGKSDAYASGNTLMLGEQPLMVCYAGDPSASELAVLLNKIK